LENSTVKRIVLKSSIITSNFAHNIARNYMKRLLLTLFIAAFAFAKPYAQTFSPPVGIASVIGPGIYNLTPSSPCTGTFLGGAMWCTTTVDFNNSFVLNFDANFTTSGGSGADGFCTVFGQNLTATSINGTDGWLGYYNPFGVPNPEFDKSFAVEFDIFNNFPAVSDPAGSNDHTMIARDATATLVMPGAAPVSVRSTGASVEDGTYHAYRIEWCPLYNTLKVFVDNALRIYSNFNYRTIFTTPAAVKWGFTAGIGSSCTNQYLRSIVLTTGTACQVTCDSISMADSLFICQGGSGVITPTVIGTNPILGYSWTPTTGLSSATVLSPTVTPTGSGYYYLTVRNTSPDNLVVNGDFEGGNSGFSSSYTYAAPPSPVLLEGNYSVYTDPFDVHTGFTSMGDHTTGAGQMMILNGAGTPVDVWCQTITVLPNTDYDFSAWIANCSSITVPPDVPTLQFRINGTLIGTPTVISSAPGVWTNFSTTWNSGPSTTANICIYDANTTPAGNDFAIDDIFFRQICSTRDSIYVNVTLPDTTHSRIDTVLCANLAPLTLTATAGFTTWLWNTGATSSSINVSTSGMYRVISSGTGCAARIDSFNVTFRPQPTVNLGNDTAFCLGDSIILQSPQPPGSTWLWSTGSTLDSIHIKSSGSYSLTVTNSFGCTRTDVKEVIVSSSVLVDLGPDTSICDGTPIALQSVYSYPGSATYLWSNGSIGPTTTANVTGTYWLQVTNSGCPGADTVNVTIVYDTVTLHNLDTTICLGASIQGAATGNPGLSYSWLPTAGVDLPFTGTPTITPDTSATYTVTTSMGGCPPKHNSFRINVQPNPTVSLGGNRVVCRHDSLHITASVSPQWFTGYIYDWDPGIAVDDSVASSVVYIGDTTVKIKVSVTTSHGCASADSAMITVYPADTLNPILPIEVCPHTTVQVMPTTKGFAKGINSTYKWASPMYLLNDTASVQMITPITSIVYTVISTNIYGCSDTTTLDVTVHPGATIYVGDSVSIYPGESYQISPQTNCTHFVWSPSAGLSNDRISNPIATPLANTQYIVHATNESGCEVVDTLHIYVNPETLLGLPNAFVPGKGPNSLFKVYKRGLASLNYFRIYNRWGNVVYESNDIDAGWDGYYKGILQPFAVYVYELEAVTNNGVLVRKKGNVTLIK
jgi:gliding motility-associated-like protein